jgi:hypothetical protein
MAVYISKDTIQKQPINSVECLSIGFYLSVINAEVAYKLNIIDSDKKSNLIESADKEYYPKVCKAFGMECK